MSNHSHYEPWPLSATCTPSCTYSNIFQFLQHIIWEIFNHLFIIEKSFIKWVINHDNSHDIYAFSHMTFDMWPTTWDQPLLTNHFWPTTFDMWPTTWDQRHVTCDQRHVTCDQLHVINYMWHVTNYMWPTTFDMWPTTCDQLHLTCDQLHVTWDQQHVITTCDNFDMWPITYAFSHTTFDIKPTTFDIKPTTWNHDIKPTTFDIKPTTWDHICILSHKITTSIYTLLLQHTIWEIFNHLFIKLIITLYLRIFKQNWFQ